MKNFKTLTVFLFTLLIISCGSDDNDDGQGGNGNNEPLVGNYYPSTVDDQWVYSVENTNADDPTNDTSTTDLIKVASGTSSNYTLEANNGNSIASGSMNSFLVSGSLNRTDDKLLYTGTLELPDEFSDFSDLSIDLSNFSLYDLNAANGELSSETGSVVESLDLGGTIVPITITYAFNSTKLDNLNSLVVDGETYNDIIKSKLDLELSIVASIQILGTTQNVNVIDTQDVLVIESYFAKNIGLVQANAVQGYSLSPGFISLMNTLGVDIPFPDSVSIHNDQELDSYIVE